MLHLRSLLLTALAMVSTLNLISEEYPNPLVLQRADPWIHKHNDGYYYFIATAPQYLRIEMRRAKTIAGLSTAEPKTIWKAHETGPMGNHVWAPELHFLDGKWYIYFAAGDAEEKWRIRMYVLENEAANPLEGNWVEKGQVKTDWDDFSLDATILENKGKRYYVWAQTDREMGVNSNIYISEMENPWTLKGPHAMLTTAEFSWELMKYKVNEGPAFLKRNGKIFMTYSVNATDQNYRLGLLWADEDADLLDPDSWTKSPGPVFQSSEDNGIYGPGHNSFTKDENGNDILVYHARNYKDLEIFSLQDWNRHARVKPFSWTEAGFPDFGQPQADTPAKVAPKPLFRDPIFDGAADPVVIWNETRGRWWMFYTNRRAKAEGLTGVQWVHGTHIGIAESKDQGASWERYSQVSINGLPPELQVDDPTHWAPEVIRGPEGDYHMYLTFVPGIFDTWDHPRVIIHLTSDDLENWTYQSTLPLVNEKVIDACVFQMGEDHWRLWYNNELDGKTIYYADSSDLYHWEDKGKAVGDKSGEGPKVFQWKGFYWMVTDVWSGLGVYRSEDATSWTRQTGDNLLEHPGSGEDDGAIGGHPDVLVQGDRAFLFYFTHPGRADKSLPDGYSTRRSSIQVVELFFENGKLSANRDREVPIKLDPRFSY